MSTHSHAIAPETSLSTRRRRFAVLSGLSLAATAIVLLVGAASSPTAAIAATGGLGAITGTVTDATSGSPLEGIEICAESLSEEFEYHCGRSDTTGEYVISNLPSGTYKVDFYPAYESGLDYIPQYYDGKDSWEEATPVSVSSSSTTGGIDAALREGGRIAGTVTDEKTGEPLEGVEVCAVQIGEEYGYHCGRSDATGEYVISELPSGEYRVEFYPAYEGALHYLPQYYDGKELWEDANPVSVTAPSTMGGIDAALHRAPIVMRPTNRTIAPGAVVAFPGSLPAEMTGEDSIVLAPTGGGSSVPIDLLHWGANGLVLRIPSSAAPGEYELTVSDGEEEATVALSLTAPTVSVQAITPVSTGGASSLPLGIAEDQSGNVWFSDAASNSIGELLGGAGGAVREYPLTAPESGPTGIAVDQEGNVWVADNLTGKVTELNASEASPGTSDGETEFTLAPGAQPDQLSVDPYGDVWVAEGENGVMGRISAGSGGLRTLKEWRIGYDLEGMTVDPFGNVWVVDESVGIDQVVPSRLPAPTIASTVTEGVYHVAGSGGDEQVAVAPDGNVWFTQWGPPVLGVIKPSATDPTRDEAFTAADYPADGEAPSGIGIDAAGNVFIEDAASQSIYKFTAASLSGETAHGTWTEYQVGSWITNYSEGDEGNNLAVTPGGDVVFSGYVTNGSTAGTPYGSPEFIQGYIGTLPEIAVPASSTGKSIEGGYTHEEVVSGSGAAKVVIPAETEVKTPGGQPFEGTIPAPVSSPSFVPSESADFGSPLEGSAFSVSPRLSGGDITHVLFSKLITIVFTFPLPSGVTAAEAEAAKLYYYDPSTLEWEEAGTEAGDPGGTVSVSGGEVTITLLTYHLSSFAALAPAKEAGGGGAPPSPPSTPSNPPPSTPPSSPSAPSSPSSSGSSEPSGSSAAPASPPRASVGIAIARPVAKVRRGRAQVRLRCSGGGSCKGVLKLVARIRRTAPAKHRAGRAHDVLIGKATFALDAGGSTTVHVRLTAKGKALLLVAGRHGLKVKIVGNGAKNSMLVLRPVAAKPGHKKGHTRQGSAAGHPGPLAFSRGRG